MRFSKPTLIHIVASLPVWVSVYLSGPFWYHGENKTGVGSEPIVILMIGWLIGMGILMITRTLVLDKVPYTHLAFFIIISIGSSYSFRGDEETKLLKDGKVCQALVLWKGYRSRFGLSIQYQYFVHGQEYLKYDNDKTFIEEHYIKRGDTIEIIYHQDNPHLHEFKVLLNK